VPAITGTRGALEGGCERNEAAAQRRHRRGESRRRRAEVGPELPGTRRLLAQRRGTPPVTQLRTRPVGGGVEHLQPRQTGPENGGRVPRDARGVSRCPPRPRSKPRRAQAADARATSTARTSLCDSVPATCSGTLDTSLESPLAQSGREVAGQGLPSANSTRHCSTGSSHHHPHFAAAQQQRDHVTGPARHSRANLTVARPWLKAKWPPGAKAMRQATLVAS